MKTNIKTIKITIPNEGVLKTLTTTPTLAGITRLKLKVGENIERVNHYQYSQLVRLYPIAGAQVAEILPVKPD
jgi:hypothetical protein